MRLVSIVLAGVLTTASPVFAKTLEEMFPGFTEAYPYAAAQLKSLDFRQGEIAISPSADPTIATTIAKLHVGEGYYFLGASDAQFVLSDLWGNPPKPFVLGMLFPADATPLHDTWGAVVSFDESGYVSDEDAHAIDYDDLLTQMQRDTIAGNADLRAKGYAEVTLVGWAETPRYDSATHQMYWAKELHFGGEDANTLNYNIRALGRKGVLVVNFVAGMDTLGAVRAATPDILAMTEFAAGHRYSEFDPSIDKVAAYGLGGLVAGKVLAKTGMLAVALVFLKKFWFVLLIPLIALRRMFGGGRSPEA